MPTKRVEVVPLVRSRLGRGQVGCGFFLAGAIALGCALQASAPRRPSVAVCDAQAPVPRGLPERIPFGMYSANAADFAELARNGLTVVGPWYVPAPDRALLDAAAAAGLGVIFPVGDPQGRAHGAFARSEAQTRASAADKVREVARHPAVVAWYVLPEEVRPWDAAELGYLRTTTEAIRAADPQRRPILSYQPNHYDAAALAPVLAHLDVATKGMYVNYAGQREARVWVRWSVDELEAAGAAPAWVVPEMFEDPANADAAMIAAWVRHDVYAGLVAGARGVLVYSGFRRKGFSRYEDYLGAYQQVARELNGPLQLGDVLLRGAVCHGEAIEVVEGTPTVTFEAGGTTHRVPALAQLVLDHADAQWMWLVSSSAAPLTVRATAWAGATLVSGSRDVVHDRDAVRLPPWGVAVLRRARNHL